MEDFPRKDAELGSICSIHFVVLLLLYILNRMHTSTCIRRLCRRGFLLAMLWWECSWRSFLLPWRLRSPTYSHFSTGWWMCKGKHSSKLDHMMTQRIGCQKTKFRAFIVSTNIERLHPPQKETYFSDVVGRGRDDVLRSLIAVDTGMLRSDDPFWSIMKEVPCGYLVRGPCGWRVRKGSLWPFPFHE